MPHRDSHSTADGDAASESERRPSVPDQSESVVTHHVTVTRERSKCGSPGHTDLLATCSCGWATRHSHGKRSDVSRSILHHRVAALEAVVGLSFVQEWEPGT